MIHQVQSESSSPLAVSRKPSNPAQSSNVFLRFPSPVLGSSKLDECSPSGTASAVASPQHDPSLPYADAGALAMAANADSTRIEPSAAIIPNMASLVLETIEGFVEFFL